MNVTITGVPELNKALAAFGKESVQAADRGLQRAGGHIVEDAREALRKNNINATGRLSQTGRVQRTREAGGGWDAGFMAGEKNYAGAVEYGRRPGRIPPPDEIASWAYKKLRIRDLKKARAIGWGAAVNIGKHGTKPHPFFAPAVAKNRNRVLTEVRAAVLQVMNRTHE